MNYFKAAEQVLGSVPTLKKALENLKRREQRLLDQGKPRELGAIDYSKPFTDSHFVSDTLNELLELSECTRNIAATEKELAEIERIIEQLSEEHKKVVVLWYIEKHSKEAIMAELYEGINITDYSMRRVNEVEDATQVAISGDIAPVKINSVNKNGLRYLYYRYKKTSDDTYGSYTNITSSTEYDDNGFSFESDEWISLDADYSYYVQFLVTDKLTSDTVTITVPQGTPLLALRRKKVGINKREPAAALDVAGSVMMNGFNVLGLVATLGNTEDLNNLTSGGIYTQAANANASTDKHYPAAIAGFLEVIVSPSGYIMQRYTAYNNSAVYVRTRYNNTWYAWKSVTLS